MGDSTVLSNLSKSCDLVVESLGGRSDLAAETLPGIGRLVGIPLRRPLSTCAMCHHHLQREYGFARCGQYHMTSSFL